MPITSFEIRLCQSCGLRYPLTNGQTFGARCPICMGDTRLLLSRNLIHEPGQSQPASLLAEQSATNQRKEPSRKHAVLIDNIRSAWNVGSILRTADGFGFNHAFLCGISPTPENEAVAKTSLGAEDSVPWSYHKDAIKLVKGLKKDGWKILALEETPNALPITTANLSRAHEPAVLILGNEITGIDPELFEVCDAVYQIPMRGEKKSFNVAIAFGIAAYQITLED